MNIYKRTFEENEKRLTEIVSASKESKNYKEASKIHKFWKQVATGENQQEYVLDFRPSETKEQKKVRMHAYNPMTSYLTEKVKTVFEEADRSNKVKDRPTIEDDDSGEKLEKFNKYFNNYFAGSSVRSYMTENFCDRVIYDPNGFEVIEYEVNNDSIVDNIFPKFYSSPDVVDFLYINGWLQYLVVRDEIEIKKKEFKAMEKRYEYTLYAPDYKIKGVKVYDDDEKKHEPYQEKYKRGYFIEAETEDGKGDTLFFEETKTFSKRVPAIRVGFVQSRENKDLKESVLRPAKHTFIDNIQKKANYDTILKAHGIYRTFARVPKCEYKNQESGLSCYNGKLQNGDTCPSCKGTGKTELHNSELDVITFPIQNDLDPRERIVLSDMIYTETIDTTLIDMYRSEVESGEKKVSLAIFNTNIFDRRELLAGTATEIKAQFKNVNNKLYKYEFAKAKIVKFISEQIAIFLDLDEKFKFTCQVPSDFELETLDDLLLMLEKAKGSGAPQHFINEINEKIMKVQHEDNPEIVQEIMAFEKFKPFNDLPDNERLTIITLLEPTDPVRITFTYYSEIVKKIKYSEELTYLDENDQEKTTKEKFYLLPHEVQEKIFAYYAQEYFVDNEGDEEVDGEEIDGEEADDINIRFRAS